MENLYFTVSGWFTNSETLKLLKLFNFELIGTSSKSVLR